MFLYLVYVIIIFVSARRRKVDGHITRSDKKPRKYHKPSGQLSSGLTSVRNKFINAKTPERKIDAYEEFSVRSNPNDIQHATDIGAMLLDIAMSKELSISERDSFFEASNIKFIDTISKDKTPFKVESHNAQKYLTFMPIYKALADGAKPSRQDLDKSYDQTIFDAKKLSNFREQFKYATEFRDLNRRTVGSQSELCILALLHRYERSKLADASWLALPSMYSQDNSTKSDSIKNSWDISGLTSLAPDDDYDLSYKIQVKTNKAEIGRHGYANDIVIISPNADLMYDDASQSIKQPRNVANFLINLLIEEQGNNSLTSFEQSTLEISTNNLLDALDNNQLQSVV